jgi:CBS domain containing-hemolysin-like protein
MMVALLTASALLATLGAAYCAFADGALLAVDEEQAGLPSSVAALVGRREHAHRALAFGRICCQLLAGAGAAAALKASAVSAVQVAPLVVVAGILIVVVAESAARAGGDIVAHRGVAAVRRGIGAVENLMRPVVAAGRAADRFLEVLIPPTPDNEADHETTVEQFREVVAAEANVTGEAEQMLRGVFDLGDTQVQDILVPRVDVVGVDHAAPWDAVLTQVRASRHARYVVFDRTLDNVVGIVHAKDLLSALVGGGEPSGGWRSLVRPAQFIPATKTVDAQLRDFKATRQHLAIVVDEFGGMTGIVTLEDALEVIVGEIRDEHDVEEPEVRRESPDVLSVSARVTLGDLSELTGVDLTREDVQTVGGLVYAVLGTVPRTGDAVTIGHHRLVVERVARRRIERVRVEREATRV